MMHPPEQALAHLAFEVLLLGAAVGVALLLGRRGALAQARYLLVLGGTATLLLGTIADVAAHLAGYLPDVTADEHLLAGSIWQGMGVALLGVGLWLYAWHRRRWGFEAAAGLAARCGRHVGGCAACRDRTVAHVCAVYPGPTILCATEGFARLAGRPAADLQGLPLSSVLDLPALPAEESPPGRGAAPTSVRAAVRLPDGTSAVVLATVDLEMGRRRRVVSIGVADAAALVAAERQVHDAQTLQAGIAERAPLAILVLARDGTIHQANVAATYLLGRPRQALVGRLLAGVLDAAAAEPVDVERFLSRAWQDQTASLSVAIRQHGQRSQSVELVARAFWELPEPVLLLFGRSLAYERRLEQQLAGTHRLTVLGQLADGMAHDVNNILATILGRTQLLMQGYQPIASSSALALPVSDTRSPLVEALRLLERAAVDGGHIVRRTLDLARGRRREAAEVVDLNAVATDAVAMCQTRMKRAAAPIRAEVRLASVSGGLFVRGDASELRELLINLILNSVDALPHGGVLRVDTQRRADAVHLVVTDTGQGMDAAVQARMFEPFFTTKGNRGTGLGLTLVRQITTRHQAELAVESAPGKGTTVRVKFPTVNAGGRGGADRGPGSRASGSGSGPPSRHAGRASDAPNPKPKALNPRTGRVLVVDDDEDLGRVAQDILLRAGHQVRATASARQALAACARRELDGLLIDLEMPEMDGWQLAQQARQLDPAVALVVMSGWGDDLPSPPPRASAPPGAAAPPMGSFDFRLPKPFQIEQLLATVSEAVSLTATRRAEMRTAERGMRNDTPETVSPAIRNQ